MLTDSHVAKPDFVFVHFKMFDIFLIVRLNYKTNVYCKKKKPKKYVKYEVIVLNPISSRENNVAHKFQVFNYGNNT